MILTLKYFGQVAEAINKNEENFDFQNIRVSQLNNLLIDKYPQIAQLDYQFAVNKSLLENDQQELKEGDEVAFLPPFAGG